MTVELRAARAAGRRRGARRRERRSRSSRCPPARRGRCGSRAGAALARRADRSGHVRPGAVRPFRRHARPRRQGAVPRAPGGQLRPVPAALLAATGALIGYALYAGGGFGDGPLFWIGCGAFVLAALALGAMLAGFLPAPSLGVEAWLFLALLTAFVLWNALSISWSIEPDRSWHYTNRGVAYLAFAVVGLALAAVVRRAPTVVAGGLAAMLGVLAVLALAGKVFPSLEPDYGRLARMRWPVGYWNVLALLLVLALPLALWLGSRVAAGARRAARVPRSRRAAADLLARRARARDRARRRVAAALGGAVRRAPDARRGRAARARRRGARARAPGRELGRAAALGARARRGDLRRRGRRGRARRGRARAPARARARGAGPPPRARPARADRVRCARRGERDRLRRRRRPVPLPQPGERAALEPADATDVAQLEQPLVLVAGGLARVHRPSAEGHGRGDLRPDAPALPDERARRHGAAQPAAAMAVRARAGRVPARRRRGARGAPRALARARGSRRRAAGAGRARARGARLSPLLGLRLRLGLRRGHGAGPARHRASCSQARRGRSRGGGRCSRSRPSCSARSRSTRRPRRGSRTAASTRPTRPSAASTRSRSRTARTTSTRSRRRR